MTSGRPAPVAAHLRRPLWWLLVLVPLLGVATVVSIVDAGRDERRRDRSIDVTGTLVDRETGDAGARVRYVHPVTEQELSVTIPVWDRGRLPAREGPVALDADPDDPEGVRLDGDVYPATGELGWDLPYLAVPLAVWARRRWGVARTERLMAGAGSSFAMLAAIAPVGWSGRRTELHLWALDAAPGSPSMCRVGLAATGHLPLGGNVFRVEVKGQPRPFGRIVARSPETGAVLWPAGAALPRGARPRPQRTVAAATMAAQVDAPPGAARVRAPWQALAFAAALSVLGVLVLGGVISLVVRGVDEDHRLRRGERVVAEVTEPDESGDLPLVYSVGGERRAGRAEVIYLEDFPVGRRYPAYVDPDDPSSLHLARSRYDPIAPVGWASPPLLAGLVLLGATLWQWRMARRLARRGPWRPLEMWAGGGDAWATLVIPGTGQAACSARLGLPGATGPLVPGRPTPTLVAGDPQPGGRTVVSLGGTSVVVHRTGAARQLRWWTS